MSRGQERTGAAPAREVALRVLRRVDEGAYADRALPAEARKARLGREDRALATRLVYGATQRRRTLDWVIDESVDRPAALEPAIRDVLRLGAYQLLFLGGAPGPVVVDEGVRQARGLRGSAARRSARAGLVNATLRRVAADPPGILERLASASVGDPGLRHSMPDWIADRLVAALGPEDAEGVMDAANLPAESAIRWNPLRGPRATLERELPARWHLDASLPEAYVLDDPFALEESRAWARGLAMGQSRASMVPARALAPAANERVIDLCAAPGAKTTHLAALARNACRLTAVELHESRARGLERLAHRMGALVEVVAGDAREVPLPEAVDAVLLDPPCTGLGVLSARPDARWRRREESLGPLVEIQRGLVIRAMELLRPGGRLVYSTCTLLPEENEGLLADLGLELDPTLADEWPDLAHPRVRGALLVLPHRHGTDGFFVARVLA